MPASCPLATLVHALGPRGFGLGPRAGLFLMARPHPELTPWREITGWQPWRRQARAWDADGRPRVESPDDRRWPLVLALPGKSRDETRAVLATAHDLLEPGGTLIASIPNDCGAARHEKELAAVAGKVESISKNKCRAFLARRDDSWNRDVLGDWRALARPGPIPGTPFSTVPGVFSAGRVDAGSALLAAHLPAMLHGRVADLGAGWGFLSHAVLSRFPRVSRMDLFEADARALDLARHNLASAIKGPPGRDVAFHWHDVTDGLPELAAFDAVVMNPPFHEGRGTDLDLGGAFLAAAAAGLRRGGLLALVANRQLPYEATLRALGMHPRVVTQDATYKVLTATRS